jgi:hypothetical protein
MLGRAPAEVNAIAGDGSIGTLRIVESMRRHHSPLIVVIGRCVGRGAYDGSVRTCPVVVVIVTYSTATPDGILRCRDAAADFTIAFRCRITNLVARLPAGHHINRRLRSSDMQVSGPCF